MPKYEIMLIIEQNSDVKAIDTIAKDTLNKTAKFQTMKQTELAYEINKSKTAKYLLLNVETDGKNIKEFTRKININKNVWRYLIVNKDHELKLERLSKEAIKKAEKRKQEYLKRKAK